MNLEWKMGQWRRGAGQTRRRCRISSGPKRRRSVGRWRGGRRSPVGEWKTRFRKIRHLRWKKKRRKNCRGDGVGPGRLGQWKRGKRVGVGWSSGRAMDQAG